MRRNRKTLAILDSAVAVAALTAGCADTMSYLGVGQQAEASMSAGANPCNPCASHNPCNPCAAHNPCASHNPCNPCASHNPCAAHNPCNPCSADH